PTNHLDLPSIQWFEEELEGFPGALLIVSHDRTFLRRHVSRVVELDGHGRCTVYEGGYDQYLSQREERRSQLLARKANQERDIAQMERFVERFRAKATKARQAQSRIKALERIDRIEIGDDRARRMRLRIPDPPRSGQTVISLDGLHKSYGDHQVYQGVDFEVQRGERVALAGPNGAGKSTLLRIVAGILDFDAGERKLGHEVELAFYAQHQLDDLSPQATVLEELSQAALQEDVPRLRGHLGAFLFSGDDVNKKVGVLSGGEKARVALAKLLLRPVNLLVLDAPPNHLDIESCEILERALSEYAGTLVFVSHDRTFINQMATRVVEVRHGVLQDFIGNYDDYQYRKRQLQQKAEQAEPQTPSVPAIEEPPPGPGAARELTKTERKLERERRKTRDRTLRKIQKLEAEIQEQEAELERLGWRLADPEVYADTDQVSAIQSEQAALKADINAMYSDWQRADDELTALEDLSRDD
ncbi:MAG: ATP-binding cassette domain-containing protein, partial [Myxococcota bacterium]